MAVGRLPLRKICCLVLSAVMVFMLAPTGSVGAMGNVVVAAPGTGVPGEYVVQLTATAGHPKDVADRLVKSVGGELKQVYSSVLRGFAMRATEEGARRLAANPLVATVEQNRFGSLSGDGNGVQDDPPWGLDRIDQRNISYDNEYVYPSTAGGVTAYVVDTGIRDTHNDFGGRVARGYNVFNNRTDQEATRDCTGHGTHVAGTIGGNEFGVAKRVTLVPILVTSECPGQLELVPTTSELIEALDWIGAHLHLPAVVNMSLSMPGSQQGTDALDAAVRQLIGRGATVVASAGNADKFEPNARDACLRTPARIPEVVTVSATDQGDRRLSDANFGPCVKMFAPGWNILSAFIDSDDAAKVFTGTSMATPHVAGAAALILAEHPGFSPGQVREALYGNATRGAVSDPAGAANRLLYVPRRQPDGSGAPNGDLNEMFRVYGDQGGHWTGGDETVSVALPDGRVAWLFSDSFLGTVNPDGSRPPGTPMVHNCIVVQTGSVLTQTLTGGSEVAPKSLVGAETDNLPADAGYWVDDALVVGGQLKVFYTHYRHNGGGVLDVQQIGTAVATFSLPSLGLVSLDQLSFSNSVKWGTALVDEPDYTYIYGVETGGNQKFLHLARVPRGQFGANWEFWADGAWAAGESASSRMMSGVGDGLSVTKVGDRYVMITQDTGQIFNAAIAAYYADTPTGPFRDRRYLYETPESGGSIITYDPRMHPRFSAGGKIVLSYNVNSLNNADVYADVHMYRPRFVTVDLPAPSDPHAQPPIPTGLRAQPADQGVELSWDPPDPAIPDLRYHVYQRDVTAGDSQFTRLNYAATEPRYIAGYLTNGHQYQFEVSAFDDVAESPPSTPVTATPDVKPPDQAPGGPTADPQPDGTITVGWQPVPGPDVSYLVYQRDVTAGETDFTRWPQPLTTTSATARYLVEAHLYEFRFAASNAGGVGPASETVSATSHTVPPGAPANLTATALEGGSIALAWQPPGPDLWYRVYQRDVTEGDVEFTQWELPITSCCAINAMYLDHGHIYEFKVSATNAGGEGPPSNLAQATSAYTMPSIPTGVRAAPGDGEVAVSWDATSDDIWHRVYMRDVTAGETEFTPSQYPISSGNSVTMQYLVNGDTYEFRITASNQAGETLPSPAVSATPTAPLPAKASGLTATTKDNGTIGLSWNSAGAGLYYWVYWRDVTAGENDFRKSQFPTDQTTATWEYLTHMHTYQFKIVASGQAGDGPASDPVSALSRYSPPPPPANLRGDSSGDATINLDWDAPGPNLYYWVYWRDVTAGETTFAKSQVPTDKTSATWSLLKNAHVYEFKVTASNQGGEGAASAAIRVTAKGGLPQPPRNLTASAGDGHVRLTWQPSTTANVLYWVYQRDVTANQSWQKFKLPLTATTVDAQLLVNGHEYEFKVTASGSAGDSKPSNVVQATPMPPLPAAPRNLTADAGNGQARLNWTASPTANVLYWVYQRDVTAGQSWRKLKYPVNATTLLAQYLANAHEYEFKVAATNLAGDSPASNVVRVKPMPPVPQAPSGLSASPGDGLVRLQWSASATPDVYYWIEMRDATAGQGWRRLKYPVSKCCSLTVNYLTNGHTYQFRVRSNNLAGDSAPSNVDSAKPMPPFPARPSGLTAVPTGSTSLKLDWNSAGNKNVYYWIYVKDHSDRVGFYRMPYPVKDTKLDVKYLFHGHTYTFYVTASNAAGESAPSLTATVLMARPGGDRACTSVTTAHRGTYVNGHVRYIQQDFVTGLVCGERDSDNKVEVMQNWSVRSGHTLYSGIFWYLLIDCTEGYTVWHSTMEYPRGTSSTAGTVHNRPAINPDHYYAVRVWGVGQIKDGKLTSTYSYHPPPGIIPFDTTSDCF